MELVRRACKVGGTIEKRRRKSLAKVTYNGLLEGEILKKRIFKVYRQRKRESWYKKTCLRKMISHASQRKNYTKVDGTYEKHCKKYVSAAVIGTIPINNHLSAVTSPGC